MITKLAWRMMGVLVVLSLIVACAAPPAQEQPPAAAPTEALKPTEPPAEAESTELNAVVITCCSLESQWDASFIKALDRVKAEKPHGLTINYEVTENTWGDDAIKVARNYLDTAPRDIVWLTSTYSDQVEKMMNDYPETVFVVHGSGNRGLGKNQFWVYMRVHEAAYLLGMMAGKLTKTDKVGAVGTFAYDDVNDELNAFFQGAKDVNPDVKVTVSFIESWYDPVKGNEATTAQAAAGVDWMIQLADGWEACATKDIMCFGNFGDQNPLASNNVPNSTLSLWDPSIRWILEEWWAFKTEGKAFNGNAEPRWFSMADGGSDIGEWYVLNGKIPQDIIDEVMAKRQEILSGSFKVPLNIETPKSDAP
jgi:basic membrane lipoprotein Med (substrate-binding protein (PBP1-ABC) superfamily)